MQNLAHTILEGVDQDVERRVNSCVERFRERVRDGVKDAYMFTLGARKNVRHTISISIERGDAVLAGVVRSDDSLGMALSAYRDSIAGGLSCIRRLQSAKSSLQGVPGDELDAIYPDEESDTLEQFLVMLDGRIERAGIVQRLMSLTTDFLGAYSPAQRSGQIVLNWGLIGLLAPRIDVSVEALTLKVLAHEYAHALSHLGVDANGEHWELEAFWQADVYVHEGLANYFSAAALAASDDWWFREALIALERMVERQSEPYREFNRWKNDLGARPEGVRAALRTARTMARVSNRDFDQLLRDYSGGR